MLLKKGKYELAASVHIDQSGVVLRGEGQGVGGTVLVATAAKQYTLVVVGGPGSGFGEVAGSRTPISSAFVAVGSRTFDLQSAANLHVGDPIIVLRTPNQAWIDALGTGPYGWTASGYAIGHERTITAVKGNAITVDIPIVDTIETKYGGGAVYRSNVAGRIRHTGVEDLRLESTYANDTDEKHGWNAIALSRVADSWVRRVTTRYFGYSAVTIGDQATFNTVEDTACLDPKSQLTGGRRYSFNVSGGLGTLIQRVYTRGGPTQFRHWGSGNRSACLARWLHDREPRRRRPAPPLVHWAALRQHGLRRVARPEPRHIRFRSRLGGGASSVLERQGRQPHLRRAHRSDELRRRL